MTSPIARLNEYGQSPWYDNIRRSLLEGGELTRMITDDGIRGVTSNPTIFEKAISAGTEYDDTIQAMARQGLNSDDIGWELLATDVGTAADLLRPTYDACGGADGFVSIEVSPELAADTEGTITQARELHERLDRPNVMVKIPATPEGIPAIEAMIGEGRNINVTLIFSLVRYGEVIEAYFSGLERLAAAGGDLSTVNSVASFFVSRVDTEADRRLPDGHPLRGKVAVANAKLAYQLFKERHSGARWDELAAQGAKVQRPLWASTSTKNPEYSDTLYVDELDRPPDGQHPGAGLDRGAARPWPPRARHGRAGRRRRPGGDGRARDGRRRLRRPHEDHRAGGRRRLRPLVPGLHRRPGQAQGRDRG